MKQLFLDSALLLHCCAGYGQSVITAAMANNFFNKFSGLINERTLLLSLSLDL